jgi:branched-chain amino acid transport system substrate-binding protein
LSNEEEEKGMRRPRLSPRLYRRSASLALVAVVALVCAITAIAATTATGPVLDYGAYVSGHGKANPKLAPVLVGWINGQGGTVPGTSFPDVTNTAQSVVKMINTEYGGVWGHPLKLVTCFIASAEEEGTKCAQKMANTKGLKAIVYGVVVVGNQSIYNVIKGKIPVIMGVSASNADVNAKNVFSLIGTSISVLDSFGPYAKKAWPKAKTASIVYPNSPGSDVAAKSIQTSMQSVGIKGTLIAHDPAAADLAGVATQANGYDLVVASCNFSDCALLAKGLSQIGSNKPVLTPPLATFIPPAAYPGGDFPKWDVGVAQSFIFDTADPEIQLYKKKANQYGVPKLAQADAFGQLAFTSLLSLAKIMNTIPLKNMTPAAIASGYKKFKGPLVMATPHVGCGTVYPSQPAACGNEAQFYHYQGGGKWKKTSGWLGPAK